jgi:hypothetical protein
MSSGGVKVTNLTTTDLDTFSLLGRGIHLETLFSDNHDLLYLKGSVDGVLRLRVTKFLDVIHRTVPRNNSTFRKLDLFPYPDDKVGKHLVR